MTQIDFYIHADSRLQVACTLAAKALRSGVRTMILTPDGDTTERMGRMLYSHAPLSFLPHCRAQHRLAPVTPIILDHVAEPVVHEQVLVNLRDETPPHFSRFERLIEIVSRDEADRERARTRFRFYRERGYDLRTHELNAAAS